MYILFNVFNLFFRIIEIAGGREIYSQSRTKALRKSRQVGTNDDDKKKSQKSPVRQGVWELRGRYSDQKKSRNSRDLTETVFSSEVCSLTHQQQHLDLQRVMPENETKVMTSPTCTMGEVVVFDDIGDTWREENEKKMEEPAELLYNHSSASSMFNNGDLEAMDRVTKVIGNLPIAVYEGSPKRYGPRQVESNCSHPQLPSAQSLLASPSVYPPRPGFPQRVVCTPSETEPPGSNLDCSSFSVSNQVLKNLF